MKRASTTFAAIMLALSASLSAAPIPAPSLDFDGLEVASPNIGQPVIAQPGQTWLVCFEDQPNLATSDRDYQDRCSTAAFGPANVLTLTDLGGISANLNFIGVHGQFSWVGPWFPSAQFTYAPGVETIFAGYINGGLSGIVFSGTDRFYAECLTCGGNDVHTPEPLSVLMVGVGLVTAVWWRRG